VSGIDSIKQTIKNGIPNTAMIPWGNVLTDQQLISITDYIISVQGSTSITGSSKETELIATEKYTLQVEKIITEDLRTPWSIEFVHPDTALISEKHGNLKWIINGVVDPQPILGLPETFLLSGTGGYMDIALDPNFKRNGWIYLSFSHTNGEMSDTSALALTKIVRGKIEDHHWKDEQNLFEVPDSLMVIGGNRWGCRFLFDQKGYLYFSIGDMGRAMDSQDPGKATGKVFRIRPDGSIPEDNPFVDIEDAIPEVYSLGNRNVQGIDQHPVTGEIWATEHGPLGGDELNIIHSGHNYGWPVITYGINYDGTAVTDKTHQEGMDQPVVFWTPSIAACPAQFCTSNLFQLWENNLLVGALAFQELRRLVIEGDSVIHNEIMVKGLGRIRDLKFGPDGALYLIINNPDELLRIIPYSELQSP